MQFDQLRRRDFITLFGGAATWPLTARAQQPERMRLIAVLIGYAEKDPALQSQVAAFRDALAKLGWTEGRNLRIEIRWAAGNPDRMKTLAKELVDLRPDAILGHTTSVTSALAHETPTIPIVFVTVADPIGAGFGASLAHPGGNITGFKAVDPAMAGKWVELLKEISPPIARVVLLFNPTTAVPIQFFAPSIEAAASSFAMQVSTAPVHAKDGDRRRYRRARSESGRQPYCNAGLIQRDKSRTDHCTGISPRPTGDLFLSPLCGIRWLDRL